MARAHVGAKSRSGSFLGAASKNVAGQRVEWRISLRYYAWRIGEEQIERCGDI